MQVVKKLFITIGLVWFLLIAFMPKQELYYKLEQALEKQDIKLNEKGIVAGWFSLSLYDVDVYVKGINLATVKEIDFFTLLFYSSVELEYLVLDKSLASKVPTKIDTAKASYGLLDPMKIKLRIEGDFGSANGKIELNEKNIHLDFNNTSIEGIKMLQSELKQDEKGWYYEASF